MDANRLTTAPPGARRISRQAAAAAILIGFGMSLVSPPLLGAAAPAWAQALSCQALASSSGAPPKAYSGPVFLTPSQLVSEYYSQLLDQRPLYLRAIAAGPNIATYDEQVAQLAQVQEQGVVKMIGFSSYRDLEAKLSQPGPPGFSSHAEYLHSIGVVGFSYNTERSAMGIPWTPDDEMDNLFSVDAGTNSVVRFVNVSRSYGFDFVLWVPFRYTADGKDSPEQTNPQGAQAIALMYQAGLSGVGLQEQFLIESRCVPERVAAFQETLRLHTQAAGGENPFLLISGLVETCTRGDDFAERQCGLPEDHYPWQHCDQFVDQVAEELDGLALLDQPSQQLVDFVATIRAGSTSLLRIFVPLFLGE